MNPHEQTYLSTAASRQWQTLGIKHHHGIALPLFSLHTQESSGIGEYCDLIPLIDWCHSLGMDIIQLLPLNDTGMDTSPYNGLSAFALNPLFISLSKLPYLSDVPDAQNQLRSLKEWSHTPRINWNLIRKLKMDFLFNYFQKTYPQFSQDPSYQKFVRENSWLVSYCLFRTLKENQQWKSWEEWPSNLKSPSDKKFDELVSEHSERIHFFELLQYLCYSQMSDVKEHAKSRGVFIKGDIPILISRDSCDVWAYRSHFLLNLSAGAPPDMFSSEGQYWGFPIYDWQELRQQNYSWWQERLKLAEKIYHIYRIDHIVGFFRIWAIPKNRPAKEGEFLPREKSDRIPQGRAIMEMMLRSCSLFPIGEDLGVVPTEVRTCLRELGICGTKVIRWERKWEVDDSFIPFSEYIPESMTTVSTHDSDTLQLWWRHSPKEAKAFAEFKGWDYKPLLSNDRHYEILKDSHHSGSFFHINLLNEYLAMFPDLISANPLDERINMPGKILDTNWSYRFAKPLEDMVAHSDLNKTIKSLLS